MRINIKKTIFVSLSVLTAVFIFSNSLRPADVSSGQSGGLYVFLNGIVISATGASLPFDHGFFRKMAHFAEFFTLGVFLTLSVRCWSVKLFRLSPFIIAASALAAACDETIQRFVPGRSAQLSDMLLDTAAATVSILLISAINVCAARHKKQNRPEA